ncbi:hypothetical protein ACFLTH_08960 [Bacteroidota bacterium]
MRKGLILLLILLVALASCSSNNKSTTAGNQKSFIGGTTGLSVSFVDGEPPTEVTDGGQTPFTVAVQIENMGETFVSKDDIHLTLKGIDAKSFGLSSSDELKINAVEDLLENDLNPDTGETIVAPPIFVTFPELNYGDELSGNSPFPFFVDVCYKYRTMVTSQLCIKENLQKSSDDEVCSVVGPKELQNSGAPVQITSFEESAAGADAISFSFTVRNVGAGIMSAVGSGCDEEPSGKNYVTLTIDTGLPGLSCSGLSDTSTSDTETAFIGTVRMPDGQRQVRCTQQLLPEDKTDKIMIVDLSMDYDYKQSVSTSVLVKHI